jgi:hypothetical protein
MPSMMPRDMEAEVRRYFQGTAADRLTVALRLGHRSVTLFLCSLPAGTTRAEALRRMRAIKSMGRRPSAVLTRGSI